MTTLYLHSGKDLAVSPPVLCPRPELGLVSDESVTLGSPTPGFRPGSSLLAPLTLRCAGVTCYLAARPYGRRVLGLSSAIKDDSDCPRSDQYIIPYNIEAEKQSFRETSYAGNSGSDGPNGVVFLIPLLT